MIWNNGGGRCRRRGRSRGAEAEIYQRQRQDQWQGQQKLNRTEAKSGSETEEDSDTKSMWAVTGCDIKKNIRDRNKCWGGGTTLVVIVLWKWGQSGWPYLFTIKETLSMPHCPKNNLNLRIQTEHVTVGADGTFYRSGVLAIYVDVNKSWTFTIASAPVEQVQL